MAEFSASKTEGCAPVVVSFKDLSTNSPKFWNWDLGNGQLSNLQNPTSVYSTPGTYTIKLVVRNADGTNGITKTGYITVNPSPKVSFGSDRAVSCLPAVIEFQDQTVANAGTITTWKWDFGDGTTSSEANPKKVYNATGFYGVSLRATSSTGCSGVFSRNRYIRVLSGVTADFTDSVVAVCQPPFRVNFTNETSGPGTLTYSWDLGNGTSSTEPDPVTQYNAPGSYNIRLISRSNQGCSDTTEKTVVITGTGTSFSIPDSACVNRPVTFQNTSSPLSAIWSFGDGTVSNEISPEKTYSRAGDYRVKLVNTYASCRDSLTKTIRISSLASADFSGTNTISCQAPLTVSFQDKSINAVSWLWNFGDGGTSTDQNPSHTYTQPGQFDVSLTVVNNLGCENTVSKAQYVRITPPVVNIANAPAGGCIPFTFKPVASTDAIDGIAGYYWEFGEGGSTSSSPTPQHTYASVGNYTLKLTVTTTGGCTASVTIPDGVKTGTPPVADFVTNRSSVCAAGTVVFKDESHPADAWLWQFGDGTDSTAQNPVHQFKDTGRYTITLTAFNNGCGTTISKSQLIHVLPPISRFVDSSDCVNEKLLYFNNKSITNPDYGPVSYLWEFGDPANTTSTEKNPRFTYPAFGNYSGKLTVTNGSCSISYQKRIYLYAERAEFTASKATVCKNERFTLTANVKVADNIAAYEWSINGGTPFFGGQTLDTSFGFTGRYSIGLKITDSKGCQDSITKSGFITVIGPNPAFDAKAVACSNAALQIEDLSARADKIVQWTFDFGDGSVQTFAAPPFSHQYADTGTYTIHLLARDQFGCSDTARIRDTVQIIRPQAAFGTEKPLFCPGGPMQFTDSSTGYGLSYAWDFGDGSTSNEQHPIHRYGGPDRRYTVTLTVTDAAGCIDVLTRNNYVEIKAPKPAFDIQDTASICPPLETKFFFKGADYESFYWDFGDDGGSTLADPTHFYNAYGTYAPKLILVGYGGCLDSVAGKVNLYNPYRTSITYSPLTNCNSLLVDFTIKNAPSRFTFYFGDGTTDSSQQTAFQHFYSTPSSQRPYMILKDSLDCQVQVSGASVIRVVGAEPIFSPDKKAFCDKGRVYFTNYTIGNDPVVSRLWDFGDGTTSTDEAPIHDFTKPGLYLVSLTVNTQSGCSKSFIDTIRVYQTPEPVIAGPDVVCINAEAQLLGSLVQPDSSITWLWNSGNGGNYSGQRPSFSYAAEGTYTISLEAVNKGGCKNTVTKSISVAPLPVVTVADNPVIPIGGSIQLPVSYSPAVTTYLWDPVKFLSCADCPAPVANPTFTTKYTVHVRDSNGCANSNELTVSVVCNNLNFFVPNTFSPNGDGNNDVFYPRGTHLERIQSMRIFNRWGEMVFEKRNLAANSPAEGWNGLFKGRDAQADAYIFIIEFICENAAIIPYKGTVTLIR